MGNKSETKIQQQNKIGTKKNQKKSKIRNETVWLKKAGAELPPTQRFVMATSKPQSCEGVRVRREVTGARVREMIDRKRRGKGGKEIERFEGTKEGQKSTFCICMSPTQPIQQSLSTLEISF